jgi:uncharacterized protein (TIGR00255 family)
MTGFGDASRDVDGARYYVEIRSLNNKYFKGVIRLPEEFQVLEAELESELRRRLTRGTVTLTARCSDSSEGSAFDINHKALDHYVSQISKARAVAAGGVAIDIGALLALPGVLQAPPNEEQRIDRARAVFRDLLEKACEHLISMRMREGLLLREELIAHGELIEERLAKIQGRAPEVVRDYENRLRARIDQMLKDAGLSLQPADLIREIAIYAERTDIAEEIARLGGHIRQFRELLSNQDARSIGRTLDFLAQEMLREANTIASKSPDSEISRMTVEVKGAIDRIKEQVQNVE